MIDTAALREKILDLAIRGKLVPQDPSDEPASVLLERIRAQKIQMVKEGKLKAKDIKDDTIIFKGDDNCHYEKFADGTIKNIQDEIPFDLPDSWRWVRLGTIFAHNTGKALKTTNTQGKKLTYITTSNLYWDRFELNSLKEMYFNELEIEKYSVKKGDLLVCEGGDIGRSAIWNYSYDIRIQNHIHKLRRYYPIETRLYYYFFYYYKNIGKINGNGIGIQGLSSNILHNLLFPLPPIEEQSKIVKIIDTSVNLLENIDTTGGNLEKDILDIKSKILELAIQGKLVPQDPNDEPASVLLERIRAEKKAKLGKKYVESYIYKGDDNCYYEKIGSKSVDITDNITFEVPKNWEICRFETIAEMYTGNSINESEKAKKYTGLTDGYNYIATKDISFDHMVDYKNGIKIPFGERGFKIAHKGDPLLCIEGGSAGRKIAILSEDVCFVNKLCTFHSLGVSKRYLYYYLQSPQFGNLFKKNTSGLIGGVSINTLKVLLFSLPPLYEQARIVAAIDAVFTIIDSMKKNLG